MSIPFKRPYYDERELCRIKDALEGADYTAKAKERLKKIYGEHIYLTSSGSAAFELLFCALELEPGGEVVMPSFTFPSAANAALRAGLTPVFADIDEHTLVIDIEDIARKITRNTRCILPTHYGGSSLDMYALRNIAGDILIIEDAALSFGAKYKGKPLGIIGDMGVISFHETKNISGGEGGLLIINEKHSALAERIQTLYDNGTDRAQFLKGRVSAYTWQQAGMNVALSNLSAALLFAQLEKAQEIRQKQEAVCGYYRENLKALSVKHGFSLPAAPEYNEDNYHVFYLLFRDVKTREEVRKHMSAKGIGAAFHYMPLHSFAMGSKLGYKPNDLPVTQSVSARILRLPVYAAMTEQQCEEVVSAIGEALCAI